MGNKIEKFEDAAAIIREYAEIVWTKKKDIIRIPYLGLKRICSDNSTKFKQIKTFLRAKLTFQNGETHRKSCNIFRACLTILELYTLKVKQMVK